MENLEQTRLLIDISSQPGHNNTVVINGNLGTLSHIMMQVFAYPGNEDLPELFEMALDEFYNKYPNRRQIQE